MLDVTFETWPMYFFFRDPRMIYVGRMSDGAHGFVLVMEEPKGFIYRSDVTVPKDATPEEVCQLFADGFQDMARAARTKTPTHPEGGDWTGPPLVPVEHDAPG